MRKLTELQILSPQAEWVGPKNPVSPSSACGSFCLWAQVPAITFSTQSIHLGKVVKERKKGERQRQKGERKEGGERPRKKKEKWIDEWVKDQEKRKMDW